VTGPEALRLTRVSGVTHMKKWSIIVGLIVSVACAKGQWLPSGVPNLVEHQFITTGGVTYFRLVGLLPGATCCERIASYAVSRQGSTLFQAIQKEIWGGACIDLLCAPWREELVSVLGTLPPGNYSFTLTAESTFPRLPVQWAFYTFIVPTNSSPTLRPTTATNSPLLSIQVAGVSNVLYTLESSTDLINWTALTTNLGPPVSFSAWMTNGADRFYRTLILPAPARSPSN
jgi:hypothetical protein